jgi:hypothetical protein
MRKPPLKCCRLGTGGPRQQVRVLATRPGPPGPGLRFGMRRINPERAVWLGSVVAHTHATLTARARAACPRAACSTAYPPTSPTVTPHPSCYVVVTSPQPSSGTPHVPHISQWRRGELPAYFCSRTLRSRYRHVGRFALASVERLASRRGGAECAMTRIVFNFNRDRMVGSKLRQPIRAQDARGICFESPGSEVSYCPFR